MQWSPPGVAPTSWPSEKCQLPTTKAKVIPHFATPEEAMTFLTKAYNCYDVTALKRVTVEAARQALLGMTTEATSLKLDTCVANKVRHDFDCTFTHAVPPTAHGHDANGDGKGSAQFTVAPAQRSGWYMTVLEGCGDG
ncbi:MAG: hypothetical protein ABI912_03350 [Actinomycetota bacterium]